ncbi:D-alanyl-D-alanine carboxypeptidase family protein [Pararhodobacter zhoushanensis]|uniref:serine-type D-Ala-D-Ala carboxypeptidase n=1 Tax=Pararhodobacter zhoushanensis TaxID=2479545 RepID=A0ABT3H3A5_9RHOB|nr:D-alanyl-D-alanine carboxypeptidase family protein [Pararhodobacter zhoushanensis]MCW1934282.1 D-alanyl-D-alanine carboxypeptidase [Pararhodobacter zhoushanensis]
MPLMRLLTACVVVIASATASLAQSPYGGRAPNFYIYDVGSGQVLAQQNADIPLPPASMSKLMTLAMLYDALSEGRVSLDTTWNVSTHAHEMGGSSMFLETRDRPTSEDLIRGLAVVSGNDAAVAIAEGLGGTEAAFAQMAQLRAEQIGMTQTTIANASGWPDPRHRMSLHDLGVLATYLIEEHADLYHYLGETEFTWNGITQPNRVPLLGSGSGVDGLKTGHTEEAGYSLAGSARQGSRRIVYVFSGLNSTAERAEESERIITWAFRQFVERDVLEEGQAVAQADVWMGTQSTVSLVASADLAVLVPAIQQGNIVSRVEYEGPLAAPIAQGQEVAQLIVEVPGLPNPFTLPLVAGEAVPEGGFMPRMRTAALILGENLGLVTP